MRLHSLEMGVYLQPIVRKISMHISQIPFVKHVGIEKEEEGGLKLEPADKVQNHMQTVHASAQFTLAETQSGFTLQKCFPES